MIRDFDRVLEDFKKKLGDDWPLRFPEDVLKTFKKEEVIQLFLSLQEDHVKKLEEIKSLNDDKAVLRDDNQKLHSRTWELEKTLDPLVQYTVSSPLFKEVLHSLKQEMSDYADSAASDAADEAREHADTALHRWHGDYGYDE